MIEHSIKDIKNHKHKGVIEALNMGLSIATVSRLSKYSTSQCRKIKTKYSKALTLSQPTDIAVVDVDGYSMKLVNEAKGIVLTLAKSLKSTDMTKASLGQKTQSIVALNGLIRLLQDKSTENIAHNIVHNLNENQLNLLHNLSKNLKKSMLSDE